MSNFDAYDKQLLPCPSCGQKKALLYTTAAEDNDGEAIFDVFCDASYPRECCKSTGHKTPENAVSAWNKQALDEAEERGRQSLWQPVYPPKEWRKENDPTQ